MKRFLMTAAKAVGFLIGAFFLTLGVLAATVVVTGKAEQAAKVIAKGEPKFCPHPPPTGPVDRLLKSGVQLSGYHVDPCCKDEITEAYHYTVQVNDDLKQTLLYENNGPKAKLIGVEYTISDRLYQTLPKFEREHFWRSSNNETVNGLLRPLDNSPAFKHTVQDSFRDTWTKTWYTWPDWKKAAPTGMPLLRYSPQGHDVKAMTKERDRRVKEEAK